MKKGICLLLVCCSFIFAACGKDKQLENYKQEVEQFNQRISEAVTTMDHIDTSSETAQSDLLACLDTMDQEFQHFADLEVPSKFENVASLADEATGYMSEAVRLYHEVFEADGVLEEKANAANENYNRAMKRISYISSLLQGDFPDGDDINISEDATDFTPIKED